MADYRKPGATRARFKVCTVVSGLLALVVPLSFGAFVSAAAAADKPSGGPSDEDKRCQSCHSSEGLKKSLSDGDTLSLHIPSEDFAKSVHVAIGCGGCHSDVDLATHPSVKKKIHSARDYSIALAQTCRRCHKAKFQQYEGSIHAALVRQGNPVAPVCTDCHGSHTIAPKAAYETIAGVPCKTCHARVFNAYLESIHGQARGKLGHVQAPICSDCHRAHDVSAASAGNKLKEACLGCHQGAPQAHEKWLPNAGLHLQAVSCPACHAPAAQRKVDLRLVIDKESLQQLTNRSRSGAAAKDGLDAVALWDLLRDINRKGGTEKATVEGRLVARTGAEAHRLADKTKAVRDCQSCHRQGADPFQVVTVSIAGPDGRPLRLSADKDVLSSPISVDSLGGFYAIGGTRIKLLDVLLILAVLGGISVPLLHLAAKRILRKRPQETPPTASPQNTVRDSTENRRGNGDAPKS